jgi:hypothetical protein
MDIDPATDLAASLDRSARLSALAREYARFSRSAGGLSAVFGGVLLLASWAAAPVLVATPAGRIALFLVPFAWLVARQLVSRQYQRFGRAIEIESAGERRQRVLLVGGLALVCAVVVIGALAGATPFAAAAATTAERAVYVATVLAVPLIAWLTLRTPLDLVVGVVLLAQAAGAALGAAYAGWSVSLVFPVAALLMIAAGLRDHRRYRDVERELARERSAGAA